MRLIAKKWNDNMKLNLRGSRMRVKSLKAFRLSAGMAAGVMMAGIAGGAIAAGPTIDGSITAGEWIGATTLTIGNGGGTAYVKADTSFIYGAFDITGWTSAMGAASQGNLLGFGVWGANNSYPNPPGVEFQQSTAAANWGGGGASGTMNGLVSAFRINAQNPPAASIPGSLEAMDSFATGHRVWEVKMPISTMAVSAGDTVYVVGSMNYAGQSHWYPDTFFPGFSGYAPIQVVPEPEAYAMLLAGLVLLGFASGRRRS
jgi:hypothetical protein